jgi:light-regulated signal transduction histidine kinase (bacteriophytochrome)
MHMLAWSVEDTGLRNFPLHEASLLDVERLEMGRTSVFPDLTQLENLSETENVLIGWGIRSFVIIPLLVDDILVGTLNLGMKALNAFGEEQIAIAHEVATQLSVAIRQARLLEQVQAYASDLETQVKVRTEQLEAKASELEAFTYSVSHDLRQPLRAMSGFAEVLISDFAGELNDEAKHYLERIRHNAQRMGTLIDDLLGLSRVGRRELSKTEIAPDSILKEIVSELEGDGQIGNAKIQIQAMPSCKADPVLLKQLWLNLLTNAIKYSKKHEQPEIIIGAKQERQETVYFIQDNGVGFDMQYAEKLFGVFQRLHSSSEYEGTGIGLATVHRIVERHGGRIWAQAGIDKGASFFFVLGKA